MWQKTNTVRDIPFAFHREEIKLPKRQWHPNFRETGGKEYGLTEDVLSDMLPKMWPAEQHSISLRVGDWVVIGIPGELATRMGLEVKHRAKEITGAKHPIIGGLADVWIGYIIPIEQYKMGQYEASMSFYGPTLSDVIVHGAIVEWSTWREATSRRGVRRDRPGRRLQRLIGVSPTFRRRARSSE